MDEWYIKKRYWLNLYQENPSPMDFHLFPVLKRNLGGRGFEYFCKLNSVVTRWLVKVDMTDKRREKQRLFHLMKNASIWQDLYKKNTQLDWSKTKRIWSCYNQKQRTKHAWTLNIFSDGLFILSLNHRSILQHTVWESILFINTRMCSQASVRSRFTENMPICI